jgi:hypothetical protein
MTTSSSAQRARVGLALYGLILSVPCAFAQDAVGRRALSEPDGRVEMRVGMLQSDNIERVEVNETDETVATVGLDIDYARDGSRLDFDVLADIDYVEYLEDTYDSQVLGYVDGHASFEATSRFSWDAQATHGQLQRDPLAASSPDNLDSFTYLSTGPRLGLRLGQSNELQLTGLYATTTYEGQGLDGDRYGGGAALVRTLGSSANLSLNADVQTVEFDDPIAALSNYDRQEAFLRYDVRGGRTTFFAEGGYSQIDSDLSGESGGALFRLEGSRRISPSSTISLNLAQQFSDAADFASTRLDQQSPVGSSLGLATRGAFEERTAEIAWQYQLSRTGVLVTYLHSDEDYEDAPEFNRSVSGAAVGFTRRLTPAVSLRLDARYQKEDYDNTDFETDEVDLSATLGYRFGTRGTISLRYDRSKRDASVPTSEYTENTIRLTFGYRVAGAP